jgi:hypothetical protein
MLSGDLVSRRTVMLAALLATGCRKQFQLQQIASKKAPILIQAAARSEELARRTEVPFDELDRKLSVFRERLSDLDSERAWVERQSNLGPAEKQRRLQQIEVTRQTSFETWSRELKDAVNLLTKFTVEARSLIEETQKLIAAHSGSQERESQRIFFRDLDRRYAEISKQTTDLGEANFRLASLKRLEARLTGEYVQSAGQLIQTARLVKSAFELVANTRLITFNLTVSSTPSGAEVSYGLRGQPLKRHNNPTDTTIQNLALATWVVKISMPGYKDLIIEHDAIRNSRHEEAPKLQQALHQLNHATSLAGQD